MKSHTLSNEEAQEILDFLVQKHGLGRISIEYGCASVNWKTQSDDKLNTYIFQQISIDKHIYHGINYCTSYSQLLDYLLTNSNRGIDVFIEKPTKTKRGWRVENEIFFPAYTNLENILVEMDLNAYNKTTIKDDDCLESLPVEADLIA